MDSGFRRNDDDRRVMTTSVVPAKAGTQCLCRSDQAEVAGVRLRGGDEGA
jgi:hypothetical protein